MAIYNPKTAMQRMGGMGGSMSPNAKAAAGKVMMGNRTTGQGLYTRTFQAGLATNNANTAGRKIYNTRIETASPLAIGRTKFTTRYNGTEGGNARSQGMNAVIRATNERNARLDARRATAYGKDNMSLRGAAITRKDTQKGGTQGIAAQKMGLERTGSGDVKLQSRAQLAALKKSRAKK